jgi:aspartate-semialdehyde dehydrogenase
MKLAVVGATGLVGGEILKVLAERDFPLDELLIVASSKSVGKEIVYKGKTYKVIGMEEAIAAKPDIAIFSAGGATSLENAPKFAAVGTTDRKSVV